MSLFVLTGVECEPLNVANSNASLQSGVFEDVITVQCDPGYLVREQPEVTDNKMFSVTCLDNKEWSQNQTCKGMSSPNVVIFKSGIFICILNRDYNHGALH